MTETDEPARLQTFVQIFRGNTSRHVIEVDEHVSAKYHVELTERPRLIRLYDVHRAEPDGPAQIIENLPFVRVDPGEIFLDDAFGQTHQGAFAVDSFSGQTQHIGVDVRSNDLHLVLIDEWPVLEHPDRNRIRFFAGRA